MYLPCQTFALTLSWLLTLACSAPSGSDFRATLASDQPTFAQYWYAGKAEISRYQLEQAHYGQINPGEAVLIFVTEDFLTDKQVKLESEANGQATTVLKLNHSRRFVTGIYDYSLFTSVFTPIQSDKFPRTLKVTSSGQDWCGQTYTQLNWHHQAYRVTTHSYFQSEADEEYTSKAPLLEDEVWTRLRINPQGLPLGKVSIIPGTATARLRHQRLDPQTAQAELQPYTGKAFQASQPNTSLQVYSLMYPDRTLYIVFDKKFPHQIAGWEETYLSRSQSLTTRARRTQTLRTAYWSNNALKDSTMRHELGIQMNAR